MYYLIEKKYVGPNKNQNPDSHEIIISTVPARKNMSGEICVDGWCGTTNDWDENAHGEYETHESALAALNDLFGPCRQDDDPDDEGNLIFRIGAYMPLSLDDSESWIYESMRNDITAGTTTDEEIDDFFEQYQESAQNDGYELHAKTIDIMIDFRNEKR